MASRRIGILAACFAALILCFSPRLEAAWVVNGTAICTAANAQEEVQVASDGAGGAFLAWRDNRSGSYDIYVQHIDVEGNSLWTAGGVVVCSNASMQDYPRILPDGTGGAIVVWRDDRGGGVSGDIYAQRVNSSGIVQWTADGIVVCNAANYQDIPRIVSDGAGGAIIVWQDTRVLGADDIYAQRLNAAGTVLWTANGVAVCTASDVQTCPELITDGSSGAIIVWQDSRNSAVTGIDIYAQRINGSGVSQWTANGVAVCAATGTQNLPQLCTDMVGGVIITWNDLRGANWDIYAQRLNIAGGTGWGANGIALCLIAGSQTYPKPVSDGTNGAIVTWQDNRSGNTDVYAQRVNYSGSTLWTANGIALCTSANSQTNPVIIADAASGAIIAWQDNRVGSSYDIYAQRVDGQGAIKWASNGLAICAASQDQVSPAITTGETSHAIIAWQDYRSSNYDVYASATPVCGVSPTAINFGTLHDDYADRSFVIRNTGGATLAGTVSEACADFTLQAGGGAYSINPDDSLTVTVRFYPTVADTYMCTIATGTTCANVNCSGRAIDPVCSMYPSSLDFGSIPMGSYADRSFSITNTGGLRLTGNVTEACGAYSIIAGGGAFSLGAGDSLIVTVRYAPTAPGAAACTVTTGSTCGDVACVGSAHRKPAIHLVRDVPGDQGGFVNAAWDASPGDDPQTHAITRYTVWRAIDMTAAELAALAPGSILASVADLPKGAPKEVVRMEKLGALTYYWKLMSSVDAYYLNAYSEVVPTLFDSTAVCREYHYFQIIAHTSDPYTFWISDPDSARSVDNLAPCPPAGLAGEQQYTPAGLRLTWAPNDEADIGGYAIYRGTSAGFVPGPGSLVASTPDTLYLDDDWEWDGGYYYKVAAVDIHGNESGYALLTPDGVTGAETPKVPEATYLSQNFPNPFNPVTRIGFGLAAPAHVTLRIYDAAGRLVRALVDDARPAGRYSELWDGRDSRGAAVASGIYFYRLNAGAFAETRKMALLR